MAAQSVDSLRVVLDYQTTSSDRAETLYHLAYALYASSPDEAETLIGEAIPLAQKSDKDNLVGKLYLLLGYQKANGGNTKEAYKAYAHAYPYLTQSEDHLRMAICLETLGRYQSIAGNAEQSKEYFQQAYTYYVKTEAWSYLANFQYLQGEVAYDDGLYQEAVNNFQQALAYYVKIENYEKQTTLHEDIARAYMMSGDWNRASHYLDLASLLLDQVPVSALPQLKASILNNQGILAENLGELENALAYTQSAIELMKGQENPELLSIFLNNAAHLYLKLNQPQAATKFIAEAMTLESQQRIETIALAVKAYSQLGDFEHALAMEHERNALEMNQQAAMEAEHKARQAAAITVAQAELQLQQADERRISANRQWAWILVGIAALALLLIFLMYRRMHFYRKEAWRHATNWPELQKKMDALEETLGMLG